MCLIFHTLPEVFQFQNHTIVAGDFVKSVISYLFSVLSCFLEEFQMDGEIFLGIFAYGLDQVLKVQKQLV
jgi:hypothetical protein